MIIFPHFFLYISRAWRIITQEVKRRQEDTPFFLKPLLLKIVPRGLRISSVSSASGAKRSRPKNSLLPSSVQKMQSRTCCRRERPLSCRHVPCLPLPSHRLSPFSFCSPHLFFQTLPRVYSSCQSWACPLAAGKFCLPAGSWRNSPLVVFSLFM